MTDCLVDAIDIDRSFPDGSTSHVSVLRSVSCRIMLGDRIALTGPSGSGKSTLLHILGGLDEPTKGKVTWPALGARDTLRPEKISFVFQTPSLFSALTIIENIALPLAMAGKEKQGIARAAALLEALELVGLATKLPEEISGGQAQRVAIARAVITKPLLILADEPTGQLDGQTAASVIDFLIEAVEKTGSALIVATHDQRIVERLEKVWAITHGQLSTFAPAIKSKRRIP